MSDWRPGRFWTEVAVEHVPEGYAVRLDGRPVRTPNRTELLLPSEAFARAVADEWEAQTDKVDPMTMPFTRTANTALDKVAPHMEVVSDQIAAYGGSDLLCYRADAPSELVMRQSAVWDPFLDWAASEIGARLKWSTGVMPLAQDPGALESLESEVRKVGPFSLTSLHDLVALSGSLVLGLAALKRHASAEEIWTAARLDEDWQAEQWGRDDDAEAAASEKFRAFLHARSASELVRFDQ